MSHEHGDGDTQYKRAEEHGMWCPHDVGQRSEGKSSHGTETGGTHDVQTDDTAAAVIGTGHLAERVDADIGGGDAEADETTLAQRLPITPLVAYGYMVFILLYFPCVATLAAIRQEAGGWKWAAFAAAYTTVLAWIMSFAVYQIGGLFV